MRGVRRCAVWVREAHSLTSLLHTIPTGNTTCRGHLWTCQPGSLPSIWLVNCHPVCPCLWKHHFKCPMPLAFTMECHWLSAFLTLHYGNPGCPFSVRFSPWAHSQQRGQGQMQLPNTSTQQAHLLAEQQTIYPGAFPLPVAKTEAI